MRCTTTILAATAVSVSAAGAVAADGPVVIEGADPTIWSGKADEGAVLHLSTQTTFPEAIGEFRRFRVAAFRDGDDVTANYRATLDGSPVTVTVFLFKPSSLAEHRLGGALAALAEGKFMQTVWSDGPYDVAGPRPLRLFKGTYKNGIGPDSSLDYLYFAPLGQWTVKVRATLSKPKDPNQERAIDDFVSALPWEAILLANGPCEGVACNAERPMAFNHEVPETFLTSLARSGRGRPSREGAEPIMRKRVGGTEWSLFPLDERLRPLFDEAFGRVTLRGPFYTLSWKRSGEQATVRFFDGTPSEAQFAAQIESLTAHPEPEHGIVSTREAVVYVTD